MSQDDDFILDQDDSLPVHGALTGWETVIFELADADDAD
jgi:hypothetical protein